MEKSSRLFAGLLGILKAGAAYVPIDINSPLARVHDILEDAKPALVLSDSGVGSALLTKNSTDVIFLNQEVLSPGTGQLHPVAVTPQDLCYVIYTSGSTGRPKGVAIEHRNALNFVEALLRVYKISDLDRVYQGFSTAFDASVEEIWGAFSAGATLVVPSSEIARSTIDAAEFIDAQRITYFSTVPSFLAMINIELPSVRLLILGGEVCPRHHWNSSAGIFYLCSRQQ
jgi:non-ribosomal peptide synthetase component F